MPDARVDFGSIKLTFDPADRGGEAYRARGWYEEYRSALYEDIKRVVAPAWVLDIGGNYGLTALFMRQRFPEARLVVAEPAPFLAEYIRKNLALNGIEDATLVQAIVGDTPRDAAAFHFHPTSSQDSRVIRPHEAWLPVETSETTLDALTAEIGDEEGVFIKVDTQGYEERVMRGGAAFLARNRHWLIKSEFAPNWLRSQGTDPLALLRELLGRYVVAEVPARANFGVATLKFAMQRPIAADEAEPFLDYIENLNRHRLGWVDLFIAPRETAERIARS